VTLRGLVVVFDVSKEPIAFVFKAQEGILLRLVGHVARIGQKRNACRY
jgi:hypothetical protein